MPPTAVPPSPTYISPPFSLLALPLESIGSFGQGELIRDLEFSPDGTVLATVAGNWEDFAIRLWEIPSGEPLMVLEGHSGIVWGLAFSPDGQLLASASADTTARVWDWHSGALLETLDLPGQVTSVEFSPNGQSLAVGGVLVWPDAAIWVYSVETWEPLMQLAEFWNIPDIAFSPDGALLAGGGTSRNVRVWNASDGEQRSILYHSGQVAGLAISPDGATLATGLCEAAEQNLCTRGGMWMWDLESGRSLERVSDFPDWVKGVAYSPDGGTLFAASNDGTIRLYSAADGELEYQESGGGRIEALAVSPDGSYLAVGGLDGIVRLLRIKLERLP